MGQPCSLIITSFRWNTSLTSDDVYRCLPADGVLWRQGEAVLTPYFGIWDKSAGRIGNSIAFLPTQHASPSQPPDGMHQSPLASVGAAHSAGELVISTIGAFAYSIEATESVSQVTTYFLQQKIHLRNQKQIESWLTRFKELDLRLVHWKIFLPQKWKDTKIVSQKSSEIIMDTNLTVAHITHNASMILLHQLLACPRTEWGWAARLPSRSSADTCQAAAAAIAITQNYLASPRTSKIFNSHWQGKSHVPNLNRTTIASKYSSQLRALYERCLDNASFRVDVLGYTNESARGLGRPRTQSYDNTSSRSPIAISNNHSTYTHNLRDYSQAADLRLPSQQPFSSPQSQSEQTASLPVPVSQQRPYYYDQAIVNGRATASIPNSYALPPGGAGVMNDTAVVVDQYDVDLNAISQIFFDQQYIDMDRVISFDDGMFNAEINYGINMNPRSN
ncbi:hypothetical protein DL98DRAFT_572693 [Cadophora sp. DSE1049]|nr:hypothetical protein DL98DRAFT_572693 [Cadophora sp. DSE1049]